MLRDKFSFGAKSSRGIAIRSAVLTSLLSKGGNVLLQLVAMPLAYRELGKEEFGVFGIAASLLGIIHLMQIGIGPSLTSAIARLVAAGDKDGQRRYYCSAVVTVGLLGVLGCLVSGLVLTFVPVTTLLGADWAPYADLVRRVCYISLGVVFMEFIFGISDQARAGYQEVHINNLWGAAGNVIAGAALAAGIFVFPTPEFMLLVVYGIPALLRGGNTLALVRKRPYLISGEGKVSFATGKELASDGVLFSVGQCIVPLSQREGGVIIAAHIGGPAAAGIYTILLQISTLLIGFVVMFTYPLWPAVADAAARFDTTWIRNAWKRMASFGSAYGVAVIIGMAIAGPFAIGLWLDDPEGYTRPLLAAFAFYFACMVWNHVNYMVLIGLRELRKTAIIAVAEAAIVITCAFLGMKALGMPGLFLGMGCAILSISGWIFPILVQRNIAGLEAGAPPPEPPDTPSPSTPVVPSPGAPAPVLPELGRRLTLFPPRSLPRRGVASMNLVRAKAWPFLAFNSPTPDPRSYPWTAQRSRFSKIFQTVSAKRAKRFRAAAASKKSTAVTFLSKAL